MSARIGVLAPADGAFAVGVAVLRGAMSGDRRAVGVLVVGPEVIVPAAHVFVPAARRARGVARSLTLREVPARAGGRIVLAWLDANPVTAAAQVARVDAAVDRSAVVTALTGPRTTPTEQMLAAQDVALLVVAPASPDSLWSLAAPRAGAGFRVERVGVTPTARRLSALGLPVLPAIERIGRGLVEDGVATRMSGQAGQAMLAVVGALIAMILLALVAGGVAAGLGRRGDHQAAADLAALAAARTMASDYADVIEPLGDRPRADAEGAASHPSAGLDRRRYVGRARAVALATARRNGASAVAVSLPRSRDGALPLRVVVAVSDRVGPRDDGVASVVRAEAEVVPPATVPVPGGDAGVGQYSGPLEYRDGKPMRPDVARAYDRMARAARSAGVALVVVSGFRSDAEQAVLFARRPDPRWVAPPGRSLHRLGTELDLGPSSAYRWLGRNARRFGFAQRYSWEPWHFGLIRNAGSAGLGYAPSGGRGDGSAGTGFPAWVPERFRLAITRAAQRWNVGAVLLAAQLQVESGFNPSARSPAGAQGIAQFMPATARSVGLRDPWDATAAIDAQAHLMRNLLRAFGAVPLALAAYNAGPGAIQRCRCAGPFAETRAYVARILALVLGAGDVSGLGASQMGVRLVR